VFGALAEHKVRSAGRRPAQPRRLRSPRATQTGGRTGRGHRWSSHREL